MYIINRAGISMDTPGFNGVRQEDNGDAKKTSFSTKINTPDG